MNLLSEVHSTISTRILVSSLNFSQWHSLMPGQRIFMVCSRSVLKKLGGGEKVKNNLKGKTCYLFLDISPEPDEPMIERGKQISDKFKPDLFVAIGGGSIMDATKLINLRYCFPQKKLLYWTRNPIPSGLKPLIAIPTTAGPGSEVTKYAVFHSYAENRKVTIKDQKLCPTIALICPELTLGLPRAVTISTGFDAFTHGLEAFLNHSHQYIAEGLALEAVRLVCENIFRVLRNPENIKYREKMMIAALYAGMAITLTRTGLIHTMANHLGALTGISHGVSLAVMTKEALKYNQPKLKDKLETLSQLLHVKSPQKVVAEINSFVDRLGILKGVQRIKVKVSDVKNLVKRVATDKQLFIINPMPLNKQILERLYIKAFKNLNMLEN